MKLSICKLQVPFFSTHNTQTSLSLTPVLHTQSHSKRKALICWTEPLWRMTKSHSLVDTNTILLSHRNIPPDSNMDITSKLNSPNLSIFTLYQSEQLHRILAESQRLDEHTQPPCWDVFCGICITFRKRQASPRIIRRNLHHPFEKSTVSLPNECTEDTGQQQSL